MTAQDYILSKLDAMRQPFGVISISQDLFVEAILARVMSKKFRKLHADQAAFDHDRHAIERAVKENKPIHLTLHFGGNKLWRLDEAPDIEWGELFSLFYFVNWAKYIAAVYKPGVIFDYFSMDVCVERMNNVPHEQTDHYSEEFLKLFEFVAPYKPSGVKLKYTRYGDLYENREAFYKELDESKQRWLKNHNGKLPELSDTQKIATELNVRLRDGQDNDPLWREKVELEHQGLFGTTTGAAYMEDETQIPNCPTWYSGYIATGSTSKSLAKFWVGVGALEKTPTGFNEIILTPKQITSKQYVWEDVHIEGLPGPNFNKVRVLQ